MKKRETSLINPASVNPTQVGELMSPIVAEVLKLSPKRMQYWIGRKEKLATAVGELLIDAEQGNEISKIGMDAAASAELQELLSWVALYREEFGLELNLDTITLPAYRKNTWLVIADERVTNNDVYDACARRFPCSRCTDDLNTIRDLHITGTIARRFKANVEADEEYKSKSANDIEGLGLTPKSIIFKERMLLGLWRFRITGGHLDIHNRTLCGGSRYPNGRVPSVYRLGDEVCPFWYHRYDLHDSLRSRVAVS